MDSKIRMGPVEVPVAADAGKPWMDSAARRGDPSAGESMTDARGGT